MGVRFHPCRTPAAGLIPPCGMPIAKKGDGEKTAMWIIRDFLFLVLFFVVVVGWLLAWAAFHVTAGTIHLLLVVAVIFLIMHFVMGRRTV